VIRLNKFKGSVGFCLPCLILFIAFDALCRVSIALPRALVSYLCFRFRYPGRVFLHLEHCELLLPFFQSAGCIGRPCFLQSRFSGGGSSLETRGMSTDDTEHKTEEEGFNVVASRFVFVRCEIVVQLGVLIVCCGQLGFCCGDV
jgi:hypothetical protein